MGHDPALGELLATVIASETGSPPRELVWSERALRGGLEGVVTEVVARFHDEGGCSRRWRVIAKRLRGDAREAEVYERLSSSGAARLAPRLLGTCRRGGEVVLLLAEARRSSTWPWRDLAAAAQPLEAVAQLHLRVEATADVPVWDYEDELARRSAELLDRVALLRRAPDLWFLGASWGPLRRMVQHLPRWRRALLEGPLAPSAIHGDLHSGNVVLEAGNPPRVILLDWGRARVGSPLEDVCSWLQSLAFWEPAVRTRHDTLLGCYLRAMGLGGPPTPALRGAYWLAGASNAVAGALSYHLEVASCPTATTRQRARALDAARDWLRIIRRADALWSAAARPAPVGRAGAAAPARLTHVGCTADGCWPGCARAGTGSRSSAS